MANEILTLHVDTGAQIINIDDKGEIIGQFRFNPADLDIVKRYPKVVDALNALSLPDDPTNEQLFAATDEIKKQFDFLLNYNVSDEIFSKCNPLTPVTNGDFYCENVLEGISGIIEKVMNQRIERKKAKIQKATAKYHK